MVGRFYEFHQSMKKISTLFLIALCLMAPGIQAIEVIYSKHRTADSFKRISEHLSGKENPGRYRIARSDTSRRDGHYVSMRIENTDTPELYQAVKIYYVRPGTTKVETATMQLEGKARKHLLVGLTDEFWETGDNIPVAWKIEFLDTSGQVIGQAESFLWSPREASP